MDLCNFLHIRENEMDILMLMNRGHVSYYLAEWLRTLGYVVIEVNNIEQAEEILNQQRIDCIITCTYMSSFCYSGLGQTKN